MVDEIRSGTVLILGDGNFSFTYAFCRRLGALNEANVERSRNVVASVRESKSELLERYPESEEYIRWLEDNGISIRYELDATCLDKLTNENGEPLLFDFVIFNFPHVGGKTNLRKSRQLLLGVFVACKNVLTPRGRFHLTLADGQSGLGPLSEGDFDTDSSMLPYQNLDSWQPLHLAAMAQLMVESRQPFLLSVWMEYGYNCTGYKNSSKRFRVDNAETLIFRSAKAASPETLNLLEYETELDQLHTLRPYYMHDIAFWISDSFRNDLFVELVRELTKGLVKRIIPLPQYSCYDEASYVGRSKVSLCYRFIWQSINYSLTRTAARDLQLFLRDNLSDELEKRYSMCIVLR